MSLCVGEQYALQAFFPTDYHVYFANTQLVFQYWIIVGGSVSSDTSSDTELTVASSPPNDPAVSAVLGLPSTSYSNWGGYVTGGDQIDKVSGTFEIPTGPYVQEPNGPGVTCEGTDSIAIWVGIGGVNGNMNLWQAGVTINMTSNAECDGSASMTMWYEEAPAYPVWINGVVCDGSGYPFSITVGVESSGVYANLGSCDVVTEGPFADFTPDQTTAEWVVEESGGFPYPGMPAFNFYDLGYEDGSTGYGSYAKLPSNLSAPLFLTQSVNAAAWDNPAVYGTCEWAVPSSLSGEQFTENINVNNYWEGSC